MRVIVGHPGVLQWQGRLARVPRWAWVTFIVGAVVPAVAVIVFLLVTAILTGLIAVAGVLVVGALIGTVHRLFSRRQMSGASTQIIVHSARVID
jgi:uncharacterized RDD family membrane protein YckC